MKFTDGVCTILATFSPSRVIISDQSEKCSDSLGLGHGVSLEGDFMRFNTAIPTKQDLASVGG